MKIRGSRHIRICDRSSRIKNNFIYILAVNAPAAPCFYYFCVENHRLMLRKSLKFTADVLKTIILALVIILPIRYFLIQPFYVKGASMEPSFFDNEYLLIDEITYRFLPPERGEVVVFHYPEDPKELFIKRIIGLPGEKIQIKDYGIYIYNEANPEGLRLDEPYLGEGIKTYGYTDELISLGDDEYYVLGDNRDFSRDSRIFGPVKFNLIRGRALWRGWPWQRIGAFPAPDYKENIAG